MKRFITILLITAVSIGLFGCGENPPPTISPTATPTETPTQAPTPTQNEPVGEIKDFFSTKANTVYIYEGSSPEAAWQIHNDFIKDGYIQRKVVAGGYYAGELLLFTEDEMRIIFSQNNYDYMDDFSKYEPNNNGLILKEPLVEGNKWKIDEGTDGVVNAEITDTEKEITVPYGTLKALEVTITFTNSSSMQREYYAKGIGFVKGETIVDGQVVVFTELSEINEGKHFSREIDMYYPNSDASKLDSDKVTMAFETNLNVAEFFEKEFKKTKTPVFSPNVKVNSLTLNMEESLAILDVSEDFITGMNAGTSLETLLLDSIASTLCDFFNVSFVDLNIDGNNYESGHMFFEDGEYLERPVSED